MTQEPKPKYPKLLKYIPKPKMLETDSDHVVATMIKHYEDTGVTKVISVYPIGDQYLVRESYDGYYFFTIGDKDMVIYRLAEFIAENGKPDEVYFEDIEGIDLKQELQTIIEEAYREEFREQGLTPATFEQALEALELLGEGEDQ